MTNRDQVIVWAREAGFFIDDESRKHQPNCIFHTYHLVDELLEAFARLAREDMREQCAIEAYEWAMSYVEADTAPLSVNDAIRKLEV